MKRTAREIWRERVRQWKASGLTAREFAARHGFEASTLHYWSWRLGTKKRGAGARGQAVPSFVELVRPAEVAGSGAPAGEGEAPLAPFEVLFGERVCLRVPAHFDEAALRRLVRALEGR